MKTETMKPLHICIMTRTITSHALGGMELHTMTLAKGLVAKGHKVTIITSRHPEGIVSDNHDGVRVLYCTHGRPGKYSRSWWKESEQLLVELISREHIDILHSQSAGAMKILKKGWLKDKAIPTVVTLHGTGLTEFKTRIKQPLTLLSCLKLLKNLYTLLFWDLRYFHTADAIITITKKQIALLQNFYKLSSTKVYLIYNGVDLLTDRVERLAEPLEIHILCVSRLIKEKGIHIAVQAMNAICRKYEFVRFTIVGDGPYRRNLEQMVSDDVQSKIHFAGKIPHEDVGRIISNADIIVNPTLFESALDLTILEAMSMGKCVVCSDLPNIREVITHNENGILFKKADPAALVSALVVLIADKKRANVIGQHALNTYRSQFTVEHMINNTLSVYNTVLRNTAI